MLFFFSSLHFSLFVTCIYIFCWVVSAQVANKDLYIYMYIYIYKLSGQFIDSWFYAVKVHDYRIEAVKYIVLFIKHGPVSKILDSKYKKCCVLVWWCCSSQPRLLSVTLYLLHINQPSPNLYYEHPIGRYNYYLVNSL